MSIVEGKSGLLDGMRRLIFILHALRIGRHRARKGSILESLGRTGVS